MPKQLARGFEERLFRIRMLSHTGDKIHIKLPISFVKKMVQNNAINFFNTQDDIIDSEKLLNLIIHSFDYNLSGEIAHLERKNGDIIKIIID
ncbi:hypothetical protein [Romboutsia sp.]|uniref:hypothetical protein n=1 Tax=Romboutsia sp. TaxID=1965302 RepID=UPI002B73D04E|nr:hypothetical protein [Romboutsia sp.]HSQ89927.1 hypothetical protein [Romboutsia sp.]